MKHYNFVLYFDLVSHAFIDMEDVEDIFEKTDDVRFDYCFHLEGYEEYAIIGVYYN